MSARVTFMLFTSSLALKMNSSQDEFNQVTPDEQNLPAMASPKTTPEAQIHGAPTEAPLAPKCVRQLTAAEHEFSPEPLSLGTAEVDKPAQPNADGVIFLDTAQVHTNMPAFNLGEAESRNSTIECRVIEYEDEDLPQEFFTKKSAKKRVVEGQSSWARCFHPDCNNMIKAGPFSSYDHLKCKCKKVFCSDHKMNHICSFNHKSAQAKKLKADNPHVVSQKVAKI